ncbi:MAG: sialidase family protein [Anaerolineales bacterium]|nr:sialidase family protein [Anaerolineales bacterium]
MAVVSGLAWPSSLWAQQLDWSEPLMLSRPGQSAGWFPDIAVDMAGRIHVAWASGNVINRQQYDMVMYTYSDDGEQWSAPNDIFSFRNNPGESAATRPALAVDSRNILHITYTDYLSIFYSSALPENAWQAPAWAPTQQLTTDGAYFSRITPQGSRLHLIDTAGYSTGYRVRYRRSDDFGQTWTEPVEISNRSTGAAKPQLLIDPRNNLHAVWESGPGGGLGQVAPGVIGYAASDDGGTTWRAPLEFTSPLTPTTGRYLKSPALGLDRESRLVMVWLLMPDDIPYYMLSEDNGRSWSDPQPIPGVRGGNHFGVATLGTYSMLGDSAGQLHLLMSGRLASDKEETGRLLHLTWDGAAWSTPETIARYEVDAPNWPRAVIRNGNELCVVWHVSRLARQRATGQQYADLEIWFSRTTLDLPALTPGPIPTRAPTATPTAALTATPNPLRPTATPTFAGPLPTPSQVGVYRENDYLLIAAQSALPVVGLVLITFVVVWWRRR